MSITIAQVRELWRAVIPSVHPVEWAAGRASANFVKKCDIRIGDDAAAVAAAGMTLQRDRVTALHAVVVESPI